MTGATELRVLLLSGGIDSACLAFRSPPDAALFIDYGQRPALAELRAAKAVAQEVDIRFARTTVGLRELGGGLLASEGSDDAWPSPEWWPFRNQFLVTIAAAWSLKEFGDVVSERSRVRIETGTVESDGARHRDGTKAFYDSLNEVLSLQEGSIEVAAPAIHLTTESLIRESGISDAVLGWTHSCHRADFPCAECPGCFKREQVLERVDRLR